MIRATFLLVLLFTGLSIAASFVTRDMLATEQAMQALKDER
jgi:hypothetical protein